MNDIIKEHFPVEQTSASCSHTINSLDFQEINALRYMAGYILRSLSKKIARSADPLKDELILCLDEIMEGK